MQNAQCTAAARRVAGVQAIGSVGNFGVRVKGTSEGEVGTGHTDDETTVVFWQTPRGQVVASPEERHDFAEYDEAYAHDLAAGAWQCHP